MTLVKIDKLLPKSIKKAGLTNQLAAKDFLNQFQEAGELVFGESVMKKIKPLKCEGGILTISCLSSVLSQDLKAREKTLIWQLNRFFGQRVVEKIKILN
ncbi:MAG: DciA family protein [Patescibacteria group bacterium]|jgi:hypothetical protein